MLAVFLAAALICLSDVIAQPISGEKRISGSSGAYTEDGGWSRDQNHYMMKNADKGDGQLPVWPKGRFAELVKNRKRDEMDRDNFNDRASSRERFVKLQNYVRSPKGSYGRSTCDDIVCKSNGLKRDAENK